MGASVGVRCRLIVTTPMQSLGRRLRSGSPSGGGRALREAAEFVRRVLNEHGGPNTLVAHSELKCWGSPSTECAVTLGGVAFTALSLADGFAPSPPQPPVSLARPP